MEDSLNLHLDRPCGDQDSTLQRITMIMNYFVEEQAPSTILEETGEMMGNVEYAAITMPTKSQEAMKLVENG